IGMLFKSEGVHRHGGATTVSGAAQHPIARGIVDVEILVGGIGIPTDEVVEQVVGERRRGAAGGVGGDVYIEIIMYTLNELYASLVIYHFVQAIYMISMVKGSA